MKNTKIFHNAYGYLCTRKAVMKQVSGKWENYDVSISKNQKEEEFSAEMCMKILQNLHSKGKKKKKKSSFLMF